MRWGCFAVLIAMLGDGGERLEQHEHQRRFCAEAMTHRTTAFIGGLQAGKTIAGADALGQLLYGTVDEATGAETQPLQLPEQIRGKLHPEAWILSKSYTLADQAWQYFQWRNADAILSLSECKKRGLVRSDARTHWLRASEPGAKEIRVRVRTAHDPEALRATGVLVAAWCDEVAFWPEDAWLNLQGRGIVTPTRYLITTTPRGRNWLYRDVYRPAKSGEDPDMAVVECRSIDNPWASKAYLAKLRKKFGPDYAAQELDALFTSLVGYVYDFDRVEHMADLPSQDAEHYPVRVIGVDPGYGDPYAAGVWLRDADRRWWCAAELYRTKAITADLEPWFAAQMAKWRPQKIYCDKRRPSDWQMLRKMGFPAVPNIDVFGEDDRRTVMPMIRIVQRVMREDRLRISHECEWHAEEFEKYAYPDREARNAGENPQDYANHCMDEMRYAISSVEARPEDLSPRYRRGSDMTPKAMPKKVSASQVRIPTAAEYMAMQDRRMDERKSMRGRDPNRWRRGYRVPGGQA